MNINFILPIAGYSGFSVNEIVNAFLSGETRNDIFLAFQRIKNIDDDESGFFYDYIRGLFERYPELVDSVNALRKENMLNEVS